jgi:hypothetical protein
MEQISTLTCAVLSIKIVFIDIDCSYSCCSVEILKSWSKKKAILRNKFLTLLCRCKWLSSPPVVKHIIAACWDDSKSCHPEDGGHNFRRNVGSYLSHTI